MNVMCLICWVMFTKLAIWMTLKWNKCWVQHLCEAKVPAVDPHPLVAAAGPHPLAAIAIPEIVPIPVDIGLSCWSE